jgi:hypothetical protein
MVLGRIILLALATIAAACGTRAAGEHARSYIVHGVVTSLPRAGEEPRMLGIRHEAIPGYIDREGHPSPMEAMEMEFPLATGVATAGLQPGQPVEFTLRVDWTSEPEVQVVAVRPRPRVAS